MKISQIFSQKVLTFITFYDIRYCNNAFSRELLDSHIRGCVVEDIRADREGTVEELLDTLRKLMN